MPLVSALAPLTLTSASVPKSLPAVPPVIVNAPLIARTLANWSVPKLVLLKVSVVPVAEAVTPVASVIAFTAVAI